MAPEILKGEPCSKQGDVYAFSLVLYEIVTGKEPTYDFNPIWFQLIQKVNEGERPKLPNYVPKHYRNLIERCWSQNPSERPSFESIVDELKNNDSFINDSVDKFTFLDYVDYLDNYQSTFNLCKKHITFDDFTRSKNGDTD